MPAELTAIADAVAAAISAADLSLDGFDVERSHQPVCDLADLGELRVWVVPRGRGRVVSDRGQLARDYLLDVVVQKRVTQGAGMEVEVDALSLLVEEILDLLHPNRLANYQQAICVGAENEQATSPEHLEQGGLFVGVASLTYRVWR